MTTRKERSGCRFIVAKSDEGLEIQLEQFHDTVSSLKRVSVGFELLSGVTLAQARALVDAMNERIIGVVVSPK